MGETGETRSSPVTGYTPEPGPGKVEPRPPIPATLLVASLVLVGFLLFAGGVIFVRNERRKASEEWRARLSAMADDRKAAIEGWVRERFGDVFVAANFPTVRTLLAQKAASPSGAIRGGAEIAHLQVILDAMDSHYGYLGIYILQEDGSTLARSTGSPDLPPSFTKGLSVIGLGAEPSDVRLVLDRDGKPLVLFFGPVYAPGAGPQSKPVGTIVHAADPYPWLFRLMTREPTPTRTEETTLAHRTAKGFEFISPLRKVAAPPLSVIIPPDRSNLAVQRAVAGEETFGRFEDYAGTEVLAATRKIRGTDWGLVVKVDRDEAMSEYKTEVLGVFGILAMSLLAIAALAFTAWRRQRYLYFKELALGRERYRILDEQARDMVIFTRPDGRIVEVNRIAERMYGYTREELLKMRVPDLRARSEQPLFARQVLRAIQEGRSLETVHRRKDGTTFPIEAAVQEVKLGGQKLLFAVVRDVTERKRAEEALRESESRFRQVVEASPVAMAWYDREMRVRFINRKGVEKLGYTVEDVPTAQRWFELAYPDPSYRKAVLERWTSLAERAIREGTEIGPMEVSVTCKDGTVRAAEIVGTVVGEDTFVVLNDITERKRLAEEVQRTRTAKAVSLLSQAMAHEIRNPLFALQVNAAALAKHAGDSPETSPFFANIREQVSRLDVLTHELMDLTMPPLERDFIQCSVGDILKAARLRVEERVPGGSERIDIGPSENPCELRAIPEKMVRVFLNLFLNALQHSPAGGRVRVLSERRGHECVVSVRDEGEGILESMQERLFEPFATSRPGQRGIGLAIVRHHVDSQGGSVSGANNDPPPGATFTVRLPLSGEVP